MRGKVAKQLRRETRGMPVMMLLVKEPNVQWARSKNEKPVKIKTFQIVGKQAVNHYRNAKKLYKGSIPEAVKAAINLSIQNEAIGIYE